MLPKFKIGDQVRLKSNHRVYIVKEVKYSNYSGRYYYILKDCNTYFFYEEQLEEVRD